MPLGPLLLIDGPLFQPGGHVYPPAGPRGQPRNSRFCLLCILSAFEERTKVFQTPWVYPELEGICFFFLCFDSAVEVRGDQNAGSWVETEDKQVEIRRFSYGP